ncbi:hypothetical protein [Pseudorhodoferax sp.]|uniref:hypothetical protein n=1 Tax=Pseudorhodoferax sp. TaxID=1993553 RepID=UPI002DD68F51|nr:hypothetical protein [Pseudorhodoferax sp.]
MRALCLATASALLSGCAVPTTGVVPLSDGLHKVAYQGSGFWVTTASLKTAAVGEAGAYCKAAGKQARVIDAKEAQAKPRGGLPEAEALFKCE